MADRVQVYRRKSASLIQVGAGLASLGAITLPALIGPGGFVFRAIFVPFGIFLATVAFRGAYAYVRADDTGVRVVNLWDARELRWDEIDRFVLRRKGILPRQGVVCLHDGSSFGTWAISGKNPGLHPHDPVAEGMVAALNQRLSRLVGGGFETRRAGSRELGRARGKSARRPSIRADRLAPNLPADAAQMRFWHSKDLRVMTSEYLRNIHRASASVAIPEVHRRPE